MKDIDRELSALFHLFKKNGYDQEFHVHLQKIIKDYPEILSRWFYEAILRIGDLSTNPFSAAFDTKRKFFYDEVAQEIWGDIAKIRINQLNGTKNKGLDGFISLTDVIEDNPFYLDEFYRAGYETSDFSSFKNVDAGRKLTRKV